MKQIDEKYLCFTCHGCSRLEIETFQGIYRCNNYMKKEGAKDEHKQ